MTILSGQHALLTGGSGGLGGAIVDALTDLGATVHAPAHAMMDVTDADDVERYLDSLDPITPNIVICAHASPVSSALALNMSPEDFARVLFDDVLGTWTVFRAVALRLIDVGMPGRMIAFSSIRAAHPRAGQAAYAAAKAGVEGLVRALAVEWGRHGIAVNAIAPGAVMTPRTRANIAAGVVSERDLVDRTPSGALVDTDDVSWTAVCLCLMSAPCITGQVLTVDGGWSVQG